MASSTECTLKAKIASCEYHVFEETNWIQNETNKETKC